MSTDMKRLTATTPDYLTILHDVIIIIIINSSARNMCHPCLVVSLRFITTRTTRRSRLRLLVQGLVTSTCIVALKSTISNISLFASIPLLPSVPFGSPRHVLCMRTIRACVVRADDPRLPVRGFTGGGLQGQPSSSQGGDGRGAKRAVPPQTRLPNLGAVGYSRRWHCEGRQTRKRENRLVTCWWFIPPLPPPSVRVFALRFFYTV